MASVHTLADVSTGRRTTDARHVRLASSWRPGEGALNSSSLVRKAVVETISRRGQTSDVEPHLVTPLTRCSHTRSDEEAPFAYSRTALADVHVCVVPHRLIVEPGQGAAMRTQHDVRVQNYVQKLVRE